MRAHKSQFWLLFITIASIVTLSQCLYEDEVGKVDWMKTNVGQIENVFYHLTPQKKNLYVSTEKNVIAALGIKSGEIVWRRTFEENDGVASMAHKGGMIISLSYNGKIRSIDNSNNGLVWEETIQTSSSISTSSITFIEDADGDGFEDVVIFADNVLQLRSGRDGKLVWIKERESKFSFSRLFHKQGSDHFFLFAQILKNVRVVKYDKSGNVKEEVTLDGDYQRLSQVTISGDVVYAVTEDNVVYMNKLGSKTFTQVAKLQGDVVSTLDETQGQVYVASISNKYPYTAEVIGFDANGKQVDSASLPIETEENSQNLRGSIKKAFLNAFSKKDSPKKGFRLLLTFEDFSSTFFVSSVNSLNFQWNREEALASIIKVEIMDLPSSNVFESSFDTLSKEVEVKTENFVGQFVHRLKAQVQQLRELFVSTEELLLSSTPTNTSLLTKDGFGLRKLLIVITEARKIYAIQSEKGEIVWTKYFPANLCSRPEDVFVTRKASHYPPEAALLCKKSEGSYLVFFNPMTGDVTSSQTLSYSVAQSILLPYRNQEEDDVLAGNHVLVHLDTQNLVHVVVPKKDQEKLYLDYFNSRKNDTFYHVTDVSKGVITGYTIGKQMDGTTFSSEPVWTLNFPSDSEKISGISVSNWEEHIASAARILGNRNALSKYLNKNLVAVATVGTLPSNVPSTAGASSSDLSTVVTVYLIDGVSGRIIHRTWHPHSTGPVRIVQSENWVMYHYYDLKAHRYEVSVLELFESELDWKSTSFSSFEKEKPYVLQQTYIFPTAVKALGVTTTAKGITTKQVLFGLASDQVMALNRVLLDPRRPSKEKITTEDREEGLIPYDARLPLNLKGFISYYKQIKNLRTIQTAPSYLESTSLVLAYGLDLFWTRTAPANTYDILNPDFNYFALVATSVGLLIATFVSTRIAKQRDLQSLWK